MGPANITNISNLFQWRRVIPLLRGWLSLRTLKHPVRLGYVVQNKCEGFSLAPAKPFSLTSVPYANYVFRLPSSLASSSAEDVMETLSQAFLQLVDLVVATMRHNPSLPPGPPSFNVLITLDHVHIIPRSKEQYILSGGKDVSTVDF